MTRRPLEIPPASQVIPRDEMIELLRPLAERMGVSPASLRYVEATVNEVILWPTRQTPVVARLVKPLDEPLDGLADA